MSRINVLDKEIFNLIAAGEVVEKPASVVKELVENSIDAGADTITIEVKNGGKYIRVSDNGCGIEKDDLVKAFLPHATSKIATKDDLNKIGTLGFRGEALSSISAVSKVTTLSKTKDGEGNKIRLEGGEVVDICPAGCMDGTTMIIEDIFFNVPARAKFLRKDKTEENDITNYICRLILSKPQISIKYTLNDKVIYQTSGTNLYDAIFAVYGKSVVENITEYNYKDDTFEISGYIGNPTFSKPNKTYQTLIINGRYVINNGIAVAIMKAYENFLMKGTFPFYVIHINLPLDKVDVNVHPNKLDIKFEDNNRIFGIMYSTISTRLYEVHPINTIGFFTPPKKEEPKPEKFIFTSDDDKPLYPQFKTYDLRNAQENQEKDVVIEEEVVAEPIKDYKIEQDTMFQENLKTINNLISSSTMDFKVQDNNIAYTLAEQLTLKQKEVMPKVENKPELALNINDFKIIGTLFNTYILVEQNNTMFIIDQHAAHERLLFDKYRKQYEERGIAVQELLIPHVIEVNEIEESFILENTQELKILGFEMEPFGLHTFKVNTVPVTLKNINVESFFNDILGNVTRSKVLYNKVDLMWDYIAKSACKAAVKANDILFEEEIKVLLTNLSSNKDQVLLCPHGRPIILKVTKTDIEKWFKRLV